LPFDPDVEGFWNQCQHGSWYFLPWHRAYLAAFEAIVLDAIVKKGGPSDWALPYWNYDPTKPGTLKFQFPSEIGVFLLNISNLRLSSRALPLQSPCHADSLW